MLTFLQNLHSEGRQLQTSCKCCCKYLNTTSPRHFKGQGTRRFKQSFFTCTSHSTIRCGMPHLRGQSTTRQVHTRWCRYKRCRKIKIYQKKQNESKRTTPTNRPPDRRTFSPCHIPEDTVRSERCISQLDATPFPRKRLLGQRNLCKSPIDESSRSWGVSPCPSAWA